MAGQEGFASGKPVGEQSMPFDKLVRAEPDCTTIDHDGQKCRVVTALGKKAKIQEA